MVGIYKITNKVNGKIYIGQSINIAERWKAHRSKPFNPNSAQYDTPLYRAVRKYGLDKFVFEVIEECTPKDLNIREQYYISLYHSCDLAFGYNLTSGGQNRSTIVMNSKMTENTVDQIYDLLMHSHLTQEQIAEKFNISQRTVSGVNLGQYKMRAGYIYPLSSYREEKPKKKYFCPCGNEITKYAKLCNTCAKKARRVTDRPDRETLKKEIRECSFISLSEKYGVSDNAIRKWCKNYKLPHQKTVIKKISEEDWLKI